MKNSFLIQESNPDIKDSSVIDSTGLYWVDETLFNLENGKLPSRKRLRQHLSQNQLTKFLFLLFFGLLILVSQMIHLQLFKGVYYRELSEGNRIRLQTIKAPRGLIYDQKGRQLVKNVPNFSLVAIPSDLPKLKKEREKLTGEMAQVLGEKREDLERFIQNLPSYSFEEEILKENIPYNEALLLKVESLKWPGIKLEARSRREYLEGEVLAHVLGFMGKISPAEHRLYPDYLFTDSIGKQGLEFIYEDLLRGRDGKKEVEVDALQNEKKIIAQEVPKIGSDLILTIDLDLQKKLQTSLKKGLEEASSKAGAALALDPQTGAILGLVSWPSFSSNQFAQGISEEALKEITQDPLSPLFNRVIAGQYPPGSTVKPVLAAGALEEGIITPSFMVKSTGGFRIGQWFFPDWKAGGHGLTNVTRALAESVNTFFYWIGGGYGDFSGLGLEKIRKYATLFGLGEKLGIDLPGEKAGFLPSREWKEKIKGERWYIGDTYHLAIGQGDILVTPLGVAFMTAVLANGGKLLRPHLLLKEKEIIKENFISPQNLEIVKEGLRAAVTSGSAQLVKNLRVAVAGKTGTSQTPTGGKPHAWFTSFAPYENPKIVLVILVENGGEGSQAAVPIAKEVLEWYFARNR